MSHPAHLKWVRSSIWLVAPAEMKTMTWRKLCWLLHWRSTGFCWKQYLGVHLWHLLNNKLTIIAVSNIQTLCCHLKMSPESAVIEKLVFLIFFSNNVPFVRTMHFGDDLHILIVCEVPGKCAKCPSCWKTVYSFHPLVWTQLFWVVGIGWLAPDWQHLQNSLLTPAFGESSPMVWGQISVTGTKKSASKQNPKHLLNNKFMIITVKAQEVKRHLNSSKTSL